MVYVCVIALCRVFSASLMMPFFRGVCLRMGAQNFFFGGGLITKFSLYGAFLLYLFRLAAVLPENAVKHATIRFLDSFSLIQRIHTNSGVCWNTDWIFARLFRFRLIVWLGDAVVSALDLRLEIAGSIPAAALSSACDLGQVIHTHCLCRQAV